MNTPLPNNERTARVVVVGGGISGLSAAFRLIELFDDANKPLELTLFEAADRVGGVIGTSHIDGYLVERGPDMFITNKPWAVDLCRRLGLEDRLIPTDDTFRSSLVLRRGRPLPVPDGFMLLSPAKVWPVLTSSVFSPWGKLRMGLEYFVPRRQGGGDESLASFVRRRFGREALDRLIQPLVGGIYTSDPEQLSLQATLPRFIEMERKHRSLIRASRLQAGRNSESEHQGSGARYGLFLSFDDGMSLLIDELERRVKDCGEIRLNTAIGRITRNETAELDPAASSWSLTVGEHTEERFDLVVVSLRSHQAADLLIDVDGEVADTLRQIPYASSAVAVSGHRLADVRHPLDSFGLVIPHIENRKILAVSFTSRKFPGRAPDGHVLLRTFIGGAMQPELLEHSDTELQEIVRKELTELLGVGGKPDFSVIVRYDNAMPQYHVGHLDRVARIEQRMSAYPGLSLAGNAFHGVGIPDCIHSGEQAAEQVFATLQQSTT